ncbi:Flp pilus assembly protein CpaB [Janibacter terrae]|uniref:Flp pilus assembly protein CpaB n=1 Tax=Janibacter terrae TaxID=103817 RepID=UPI00082C00AB|nr:RcpC/CpaB family pilus assembly protein [Janibacter terrae]
MKRRVIAVIVAVLLALGGSVMVLTYVRGADARAVAGAQPVYVYVAEQPVPAGTTLKDAQRNDLIVRTKVASEARPDGALEWVGPDNNALLALSDVQPGEFLMTSRFGTTPTGTKAIEVPPGKLAMSVELSDPARVGEFVTPGSRIAIYATHKIKVIGDGAKVKQINELDVSGTSVLLPDVQVIAMGTKPLAAPTQQASPDDEEESDAQATEQQSFLVTVAVDPKDAPRLAHGITEYQLYAGLRGSDVKMDDGSSTNDMTVFDEDVAADLLRKDAS